MAQFNNTAPIKAAKVLGGLDFPMDSSNPEAATQTYNTGAVLILSSGNVTQAAGTPGTGTTSTIYGIADSPGQDLGSAGFFSGGSTVNGIYVPVVGAPNQGPLVILPNGVIFEGNICSVTAGDPDQATTIAQTMVGTQYALSLDPTTSNWFIDATASSNKKVVVTGLKDAVGTVCGRVYFKILSAQTVTA